MTRPLLETHNLSVRYSNTGSLGPALKAVSLDIREGEKLALIGESGSGKSTFIRTIAGILPRGTQIDGHITWRDTPLQPGRDIGVVFQDPSSSLNPVLRLGEQIAEGAVAHLGFSWQAGWQRAIELLDAVALPDPERIARAYPHQLSGGQRQRVAIAAALAADPQLVIADEATSALDTIVQAQIITLLRSLVETSGRTLLFVTHDIALASEIAHRVAVFKDGELVEVGKTSAVLASPKHPYTKTLISACLDLSSPRLVGSGAAT